MSSLAKILGGGLPGGAVAGKAELINMIEVRDDPDFDPARRISHPGTFNVNPISAAAGTKALELVATTPINEDDRCHGRTAEERAERPAVAHGDTRVRQRL